LERFGRVVLAVSGGADSMALLHLAARWAAARGERAPRLDVATVDHALRSGSRDEAVRVAEAAGALGLTHHMLTWAGDKPEHGIQARARAARYRLLGDLARSGAEPSVAIVTAHTREDQAETVLMRLARGSGPDGLMGMRAVRSLDDGEAGVELVRPLLGVSRGDLRSWLTAEGLSWSEDPSNEDTRFERVRLRRAAPVLEGLGLSAPMLALAARRQARAVAALEAATDAVAAKALDLHRGAYASLDGGRLAEAPEEVRIRLLTRVLAMFGGSSPAAELAQVERLAAELTRGHGVRTTLGGCHIRACPREIRVFREAGRADLPEVRLEPSQTIAWDRRFRIVLSDWPTALGPCIAAPPVLVRVLDANQFRALRRSLAPRSRLPARAAATLPAIWWRDHLLAVGGIAPADLAGLLPQTPTLPRVAATFLFGSGAMNAAEPPQAR
jgi:tRNA(Ile)-lysidine synthase